MNHLLFAALFCGASAFHHVAPLRAVLFGAAAERACSGAAAGPQLGATRGEVHRAMLEVYGARADGAA